MMAATLGSTPKTFETTSEVPLMLIMTSISDPKSAPSTTTPPATAFPPNRTLTNSGMVYPSGINVRILRTNGIAAITAKPFGTVNQNKPERPNEKVCAADIITAIAQVQIEISPATPKPKPILRLAMTKSFDME
jgi:hypothetical protein